MAVGNSSIIDMTVMTLAPSQSLPNKKALLLSHNRADSGYGADWSLFQDYHLSGFRILTTTFP